MSFKNIIIIKENMNKKYSKIITSNTNTMANSQINIDEQWNQFIDSISSKLERSLDDFETIYDYLSGLKPFVEYLKEIFKIVTLMC